MGIFDQLGAQAAGMYHEQPKMPDMRQEIGRISANPVSYLKGKGYNIPENMTDAKQITQYLLQTGQVGTPRLQQVMQMLGRR